MKGVVVASLVTGLVSWLCGWEGFLVCALFLLVGFWAGTALERMDNDMGPGGEF